jgi:DNA primase
MSKPFLDFKAIRERVSFLGVLDRYHVEVKPVDAKQLKGRCPLPSHTSKEPNTFCVNTEKNLFCCHSASCKKAGRASGNVVDFVCVMDSVSAYEAAAKLNEWFPESLSPTSLVKPGPVANSADPPAPGNTDPVSGANKPLSFGLKDINPEHPMIQGRGIRVETAQKWGVGFFPGKGSMAGRIVFPLHEHGHLVGYAGRAAQEGQEPKWLLGKGLRKTFLFGLERCAPAKHLVLVESPWAVLWFYQQQAQAAALMGSEMTPAQEECLAPFMAITVALDNDAAGNEKAVVIVERLRASGHKVLKARMIE